MSKYKLIKCYPNSPKLGTIHVAHEAGWLGINIYDACNNEFWEEIKEPILVTEDDVELNYPDKYIFVDIRSWTYGFDNIEKHKTYKNDIFKRFAKRENAEKYIEENKPQYSKKQIMDIIGRDGDEFTDGECIDDLYDLVNKGEIKPSGNKKLYSEKEILDFGEFLIEDIIGGNIKYMYKERFTNWKLKKNK